MTTNDPEKVVIGRIGKSYGVKGWMHIHSFTEPADQICEYKTWFLANTPPAVHVSDIRSHQSHFIAKLEHINNPEEAKLLANCDIMIAANELIALPEGEYYRSQLIGLTVKDTQGETLGIVQEIMATGANDVLIVMGKQRQLIPYIDQVVIQIDLNQQQLIVDWESPDP